MKTYLVAFGCCVFAGGAALAGDADKLTEEERQCFGWFDTLGFPDLGKCQTVKVATGPVYPSDQEPENLYYFGFLVNDSGQRFTVLYPSLASVTYTKTNPGTAEYDRIGFERVDFRKEMEALFDFRRDCQSKDVPEPWAIALPYHLEFNMGGAGQLFLLARASAARGQDEQAHRLAQWAKGALIDHAQMHNPAHSKAPLHDLLSDAFGLALAWQALDQFADPAVSRKQLLSRFETLQRQFPKAHCIQLIDDSARMLRQMVAEDEVHNQKWKSLHKPLTRQERIAEWIWQLRNYRLSSGESTLFDPPPASPGGFLVEAGFEAVPQLIAALDDDRFTRWVTSPPGPWPPDIMRVRDCVIQILSQIAGRHFTYHMDGPHADTKQQVQDWWRTVQRHGEKQALIEGTEAGNGDSAQQAYRLAAKYPDAAFEPIVRGIHRAAAASDHSYLIGALGLLKGPKVDTYLSEELNGRFLVVRVAAARGLLEHGDRTGVKAMIQEWGETRHADTEPDYPIGALISFLVSSADVEALRALAKDFSRRPYGVKTDVIANIRDLKYSQPKSWQGATKDCAYALESFLAQVLDDKEECADNPGEPRICDLAAIALAERWGQPTAPHNFAPERARDLFCLEVANQWRKKQGQKPTEQPAPKVIPPAPPQVQDLLRRIVLATKSEQRKPALDALEAIGLATLAQVRSALNELKPTQNAYADLRSLAVRLGFIVTDVSFTPMSASPSGDLRNKVQQLKHRPMSAGLLADLIDSTLMAMPGGVSGIRVDLDRPGDGTGVSLRITLIPAPSNLDKGRSSWAASEVLRIDKQLIVDYGTGAKSESVLTIRNHDEYDHTFQNLERAFGAAPEQPVVIRIVRVRERW
jgi:hypothetical protein